MRLTAMQVSIGVVAAACAGAAPFVLGASVSPASAAKTAAPVSQSTPASPAIAKPAEPQSQIVSKGGVTYDALDEPAAQFLAQTIDCGGGWSVSLEEFLRLRILQVSGALQMTYRISSATEQSQTAIVVLERRRLQNGRALQSLPEFVTYKYTAFGPTFRLYDVEPASDGLDPSTFLRVHWDAACSTKMAIAMRRRSTGQPSGGTVVLSPPPVEAARPPPVSVPDAAQLSADAGDPSGDPAPEDDAELTTD